ncbi:integration host factor subunit beta [Acidobacteria bacterium AH-259-A15]|nr:integration host factor subunit beta [Acidobacteria bacterium AH-259-A15]
MTKADLVKEVAKSSGLTQQDAEVLVQTVLDSIVDALNSGDEVELRGFGSFRFRKRNPRQARNPKTGEEVYVPAKRVPYFRIGKLLTELINS